MPRASAVPGRRRRSRPSQQLHLRDGDDEAGSPVAGVGELRHDLPLEVPRQDQDVVGPLLFERIRMADRDVRPRQEQSLLVRVAIDRELEQVGTNAAVVKQRVALAGSAVASDPLTLAAMPRSGTPAAPISSCMTRAAKSDAASSVSNPSAALEVGELLAPVRTTGWRPVTARWAYRRNEPPWTRSSSTSNSSSPCALSTPARGQEREVREVLVVDRVELVALDQAQQVRHLDRRDPLRRQHDRDPADEVVQIRHVSHHVVGDEQVRGPPLGDQPAARSRPKNSTTVSIPCSRAASATFAAGSIPSAGMPRAITCCSR